MRRDGTRRWRRHLAAEPRGLDHGDDLRVLALHELELEEHLRGVDGQPPHHGVAVEADHRILLDPGEVDRVLERLDDAVVAVGQAELDVVQRRVDEDARLVPRPALDADRLVHRADVVELAVADDDGVLAEQRDAVVVLGPADALDERRRELAHDLALLHVEERDALLRADEAAARGRGEEVVRRRGVGRRDLLRRLVAQVFDEDLVLLVEHREAVARDEDSAEPEAAEAVAAAAALLRRVELVAAAVRLRGDEHAAVRRVEA